MLALGVLSGCGRGAAAEAGQGPGLRNNSSTVSQLLEDAANAGTVSGTAAPETAPSASAPAAAAGEGGIDIDLTLLNSTMIYFEVYSMMVEPEAYLGKAVRLAGYCASTYYQPTDMTYYAVIIPNAAACCAQGIEYTLADGAAYPADDTRFTPPAAISRSSV